MITKLDKNIFHAAALWHWSQCYDDQDKWEEVLDNLQEVRKEQQGEELNVMAWLIKVNNLITQARLQRGELVRCGNILLSTNLSQWKGYAKVISI